jgi:hypothetical protein
MMFFPLPVQELKRPVQELKRHSNRVYTTGWRERYLLSMIARPARGARLSGAVQHPDGSGE